MKILVTGATGLVGNAVINRILEDNQHQVIATSRQDFSGSRPGLSFVKVGHLGEEMDWRPALTGVEVVVHCAARVHIMNDTPGATGEYHKANVLGTINLARQAFEAGVRRFIFLSTIKVNGEFTTNQPFRETDVPSPEGAYAQSKYNAERELFNLSKELGLEVVVIRPPLVYGPGVKANFHSMINWVYKGLPLPLGSVKSKRSMVGVENLADLIFTCLDQPNASNEIFLASDENTLGLNELLLKIGKLLNVNVILLPVPLKLISTLLAIVGKGQVVDRLITSLEVDSLKSRQVLGWHPRYSVDDQLKKTVDHFLKVKKGHS